MSRLAITYMCENKHDMETVIVDLTRRGAITEEEIWRLLTKNSRCRKCGSEKFIYRTRYKD